MPATTDTTQFVVIIRDALDREWQAYMRTFSADEIGEAVASQKSQLRARGLGDIDVYAVSV